jgi:hypothetical protein
VTGIDPESGLPEWVSSLPSLTYLDVPGTLLGTERLVHLSANLVRLRVRGNANLVAQEFPALEVLSVTGSLQFDVGGTPRLKELECEVPKLQHWLAKLGSLRQLERLGLSKLQADAFSEIAELRLIALGIHGSTLESLAGIELQRSLCEVALTAMPRLCDVGQLGYLQELREIIIRSCPRIRDLRVLLSLKKLRSIEILDVPKAAKSALAGDPRLYY